MCLDSPAERPLTYNVYTDLSAGPPSPSAPPFFEGAPATIARSPSFERQHPPM